MVDVTPIMKNAAEASLDAYPAEPGDYIGDDGLLYCGKCHTPKEKIVELPGTVLRPHIPCECVSAKKKEEEQRRIHEHYCEELYEKCFRYREMREWTFENDNGNNPKLTEICRNYVDHFPEFRDAGRGLLLYGKQGLGKSWFAASIANALIEKEIACKFLDFTQIANTLMDLGHGRADYIETLARYPLLILDDLDAERDTSFMDELVFSVIDARTKARKPLVVTTNLTRDDLKNPKSPSKARIISRLYQVCIPYEVNGSDQRYKELADDFSHFKKVLGI